MAISIKPTRTIGIIFLTAAFVCFAAVFKLAILDRQSVPSASLRIDSFPRTTVSLNDKPVGQTPYLGENLSPGEYKIKLVPTGMTQGTFVFWEAKIKLSSGSLTYISRNLGSTEEFSGGQILMLERLPTEELKELAVISNPDGATVFVDGQEEGRASLILRNLQAGDHEIIFSAPGYSDQVVHGKIIGGYRLNVVAKLARLSGNEEKLASGSGSLMSPPASSPSGQIAKPYVLIKETGTGFLRVRFEPSLSASETARVKPGEKYPLLSEIAGWVKIKLPTLFGWVSDSYVEKVK